MRLFIPIIVLMHTICALGDHRGNALNFRDRTKIDPGVEVMWLWKKYNNEINQLDFYGPAKGKGKQFRENQIKARKLSMDFHLALQRIALRSLRNGLRSYYRDMNPKVDWTTIYDPVGKIENRHPKDILKPYVESFQRDLKAPANKEFDRFIQEAKQIEDAVSEVKNGGDLMNLVEKLNAFEHEVSKSAKKQKMPVLLSRTETFKNNKGFYKRAIDQKVSDPPVVKPITPKQALDHAVSLFRMQMSILKNQIYNHYNPEYKPVSDFERP